MKRQIPLWFNAFVFTLLSVGLAHAQVPTISSFSPASGNIGTTVTITGTNFNATPTNNVVFFGATRATVTAATATSVTVTVPTSATYAPITLLNTGTSLAAYSLSNFTPTYSPIKTTITETDFQTKQDFAAGSSNSFPISVAIGDLDGDGKPDLVVANYGSSTVSVYRNTSTSGSIGTGSFDAKVDFATGSFPSSVAIGDLDGDGMPDLAVTSYGLNNVSVIRNKSTIGSIDFYAKVDFATGNGPKLVAIGDLDGDGKPDLAVVNQGSNNVSVIRNKSTSGSIDFYAKVDFDTGSAPASVAIGDLDGDGKPDLAVANYSSSNVSVIRNKSTSGSIDFYAKVDFLTFTRPISVAIGDLDGDGKLDLAVANFGSNNVSVILNKSTSGSISFDAKVDFATGSGPYSVAISDLDGDGKPDLAVTNFTSSKVSVIRNKSTSGGIDFYAKVDFTTGTNPSIVAIGDLDGDGRPDLAVANYNSSNVSVLRNAGELISSSSPPTITSFSPLNAKPGDAVTLVGTNFNATPTNNIVFFGATRATVTAATATSVTVTVPTSATYAPITLLNTGTSLAAYSLSNFTPTYSPSKTTITATDFQTKQDYATGGNPQSVAIGDLDGDGKPDLAVVTNSGSGTVSVYRNTSTSGSIGTGSFDAKVDFATGTNPRSVTIGDLNGDGKPDLVVANAGSSNVSVFRNKSTSGIIDFYAKVDFTTGSTPSIVAIGDLDGDGKPDLAVANASSSSSIVSVIRNKSTSGSIDFYAKVDFATGGTPRTVAIGDLDGDGKPDLAVANQGSNNVSVIRNKSTSGTIDFYAKVDFATGTGAYSVAIGDLDGDGKPDLAVANLNASTVSVMRNKSTSGSIDTGSFDAKVDFAAPGTNPICLAIGDLDGDGKPDLAVANLSSSNASVYRNKSTSGSIDTGSFDAKVDFSAGSSPFSVAIGDLDGDGRPDLAVANQGSSNVSVLRNAFLLSPAITLPGSLVVCSPSTLTLTASGCAGTVTWSQGAATGTSLTLLAVGTYSITATCTDAGITSVASTAVTGLEIKAKPNAPSITPPASLSVFTPSTLTLTAGGCAGTVTWSQGAATGTSLMLSTLGTYSITATCTVNGCISDPSTAITGLEITVPSPPTISSFSPTSGNIGTTVTITGTNFNATANQNIVFFGATKATVTAASTTSLTVTVPVGATYQAISVLNLGTTLMGNSAAPFRVTFAGGAIAATSFKPDVRFNTGSSSFYTSIGDLDGDGKPDLVVANFGGTTISVFRNISSSGIIASSSFESKVEFTTGISPIDVSIGDLDGDGKPDLVVTNYNNTGSSSAPSTISVFRNTASSGSINSSSFDAKVDFITEPGPLGLSIGDLDGDGKPDLAVANYGFGAGNTISIFHNTSSSGSITSSSFATKVDFTVGNAPSSVSIGDLDRDGKPDLVVSNSNSDYISVLRNTASSGSINSSSFDAKVDFTTGSSSNPYIFGVTIGDLDGDDKPDLVVANNSDGNISVLRNTASSGSITSSSFASRVNFDVGPSPYSVSIGDLDGDDKPDLVAPTFGGYYSVFRNTASSGSITNSSFASRLDIPSSALAASIKIGDLDGDGKPDLVASNLGGTDISVIHNYPQTAPPTITPPGSLVVCSPSTLTLTASGCAGTVTWSQGAATGTSLTLSAVGTYSISATCTDALGTSVASTAVTGLEIKAKPNAPSVNAPTEKVVCSPSTLTLTATGCAGTVTWSNAATGTSLTLSTVGTYSISATCTVNGCISDASTAVTGLEIKAKPNTPTVTAPTEKVVCFPSTLTLTASPCSGTVTWSQGAATGSSLTLSTVGTYSITATCTVNGCTSDASIAVTGLEIKAQPIISASNTGPYTIGQIISLNGTGTGTYIWTGPNNFTSTLSNPTINNALSVNAGVYTLTVTGLNSCIATTTTNVVVNEIDPCDPTRIVDYFYVKAGNPYQPLFQLKDGMVINQTRDQVSILANQVCSSVTIESMEMNIQGPELNWNILQNISPNSLFDNIGLNFNGRNFNPGNYTLTVTGYARDNKGGGITYGPKIIRFTVVGNLATINAPTLSKTSICAGSSVDVSFATSGTFNDINQYLIELSDTSGSFEKPLLIGTTNTVGTTTCLIPQNTLGGSKYLIRVVSSNQVVVSNPVISQVTVNPLNYSLVSPTNNLSGTSTKKAVDSINASNKISSPANVVYQAGKSVLLTPGFESGAVFRAEVKGCDN